MKCRGKWKKARSITTSTTIPKTHSLPRLAIMVLWAVILQGFLLFQSEAQCATQPNILIISVDNMGWGDWCANPDPAALTSTVCANNGAITPELNKLTAEGVSLTNFHAPTPNCAPSRASLLTGQHAQRHGVSNNNMVLGPSENALPRVLKELGYDTMAIGKMHLESDHDQDILAGYDYLPHLPSGLGFDKYFTTLAGNSPEAHGFCLVTTAPAEPDGYTRNFYEHRAYNDPSVLGDYIIDGWCRLPGGHIPNGSDDCPGCDWWEYVRSDVTPRWDHLKTIQNGRTVPPAAYTYTFSMTEVLTDKATAFIENYTQTAQNTTNPFFLYLAYTAPHGPLDVEIHDGMIAQTSTLAACAGGGNVAYTCVNEQQLSTTYPYYQQSIQLVDDSIGDIMRTLKNGNIADNTIVIFLSDNGAELGAQLEYIGDIDKKIDKGSQGGFFGGYRHLFEGGSRVPLIVKWPGGGWVKPVDGDYSLASQQLADMTDLFPTLIHAAQSGGTDWSHAFSMTTIDGVDLSDVLANPGTYTITTPREPFVTEGHTVEKTVNYYIVSDLPSTYFRDGEEKPSLPLAIQTYSPTDAESLNGWKLFLDLDLNPKQLVNLTIDRVESEDNYPNYQEEPTLKDQSQDFSDSISYSSRFYFPGGEMLDGAFGEGNWYDERSPKNINHFLSLQLRDNESPFMNVSVRFINQSGTEEGYCNFIYLQARYEEKYANTDKLSIQQLCSGYGACQKKEPVATCRASPGSFTGTIAVYTDKPAYVTLTPADKSTQYAALSPADLRTTHYFPKVYDNFTGAETYQNVIRLWNPSDKPVDASISFFTNAGFPETETDPDPPSPCPHNPTTITLNPHATSVIQPSDLCTNAGFDSFKGSIAISAVSQSTPVTPTSIAAVMEYKITNGSITNRSYYQAPGIANEIYFPRLSDAGTTNSLNNITVYNPSDFDNIPISIQLYCSDGITCPGSPFQYTLNAKQKFTFRPGSLLDSSLQTSFNGSVKVTTNALTGIAGVTDTATGSGTTYTTYDMYRAFTGVENVDSKAIHASKSLVFPRVVSNAGTYTETTEIYVRNHSIAAQDITFTLIAKDGTEYAPITASSVPPNGYTKLTPPPPFDGIVRVDSNGTGATDTISAVAYAKYVGSSSSDIRSTNMYEAVPLKPHFPASDYQGPYTANTDDTIHLEVFAGLVDPIPQITSWSWSGTPVGSRGAIINHGSHFGYKPPANFDGTNVFNYVARTENGDTKSYTVTVNVDTKGPSDGFLTVTPSNAQNSLTWDEAVDQGFNGLRVPNTYEIYRTSTAPAQSWDCYSPTSAQGSMYITATTTPNRSFVDQGLNNGTTYYYLVCAYDQGGNVSQGATGNGTPFASYPLDVTKNGSGAVTNTLPLPVGGTINCGATCNASYNAGTQVTLTAAAATDYTFTGWSGACTGTGTCTVTMDSAKSVTATFTATYTLSVAKSGSGTVTNTLPLPVGGTINCGATCSASYNTGTQVTLTAAAATDYTFTGWSGACTGTGTCTVTMNSAKSVTATFTPTYSLSVTKSGTGSGTVTNTLPLPVGGTINCGSTCSASYNTGTQVTLSAAAASGSTFTGWTGACTGTGTCTVTMDAVKTVNAAFAATATGVTELNGWTNNFYTTIPPAGSSRSVSVGNLTVGSGSQRLFLVSVVMEISAAANPTSLTASYGGVQLSQIAKTANTQREIVWVGYLKDAQIPSGSNNLTVFYNTGTGGSVSALHVDWAAYTGVNQTTPIAGSAAKNAGATSVTFPNTVSYVTNGLSVVVAGNGGTPAVGTLTTTGPAFTARTATTANAQTSRIFTTAKHTASGSYPTTSKVAWTGTTSKWSGLVVFSMQP